MEFFAYERAAAVFYTGTEVVVCDCCADYGESALSHEWYDRSQSVWTDDKGEHIGWEEAVGWGKPDKAHQEMSFFSSAIRRVNRFLAGLAGMNRELLNEVQRTLNANAGSYSGKRV